MRAPSLSTFGANIFLLIGLLLAVAAAVAFVIALWTGIRLYRWKREVRRAQLAYHQARFDDDGVPLPPVRRGICEACGLLCDEVLHLPGGERLCRKHYATYRITHDAAATRASGETP